MAGFKHSQPGLRFANEKITPDEQDSYFIYDIGQAGTSGAWFGTVAASGTSAVVAVGVVNTQADYPRNVNFSLAGTGAGMAGTLTYNAKDVFGSQYQETIATGTASNGGTVVGTGLCANFISGTVSFGTAIGNGTATVGFVPGTGCLFQLPVRIGSATDVVLMSMLNGTGAVTYNGGSINAGAFIGTLANGVGYIRPAQAVTGSQTINVWVKSTYSAELPWTFSNLKQVA